jgi:Cu-Zn family superoxide dismutase
VTEKASAAWSLDRFIPFCEDCRMRATITVLASAALLGGCADASTHETLVPPVPITASSAPAPANAVRGTFLPYTAGATAITYDPAVVPAGAVATLTLDRRSDGLGVRLVVSGMVPRRSYGAHLHTGSCTAIPDQAGPHYQHVHDPQTPSVDPSYANPDNEVWLDFTADDHGAAVVTDTQRWTVDPARPPRSLIVHAESTRTQAGVAGTAGPRVACLSIPE